MNARASETLSSIIEQDSGNLKSQKPLKTPNSQRRKFIRDKG